MNILTRLGLAAAILASAATATPDESEAADPTRFAFIDPLSGPVAGVGRDILDAFQYTADRINARGGVQLELVALDNAMSTDKTAEQLNRTVDLGISFVVQGVGSNHALNIIEFANRHNRRNPGHEIVYLNYSAITPSFTNELCSFWHFRFDANVDMRVAGLATQIGRDPSIAKVFLLNQNYAFGKAVQEAAHRFLAERAPDAQIVGDDLIAPFGKVLDFTPYIARIQESGADAVLTGNWGPDMVRFVTAAVSGGLDVQFFTFYGGLTSSISGYGADAANVRLMQIGESHENQDLPADTRAFMDGFKEKYGSTWYSDRYRWTLEMLALAIEKAGTDEPVAVARALEGLTYKGPLGDVEMRAVDHQIEMPLTIARLTPDAPIPLVYGRESLGVAFEDVGIVTREEVSLPTSCRMERP